MCEHLLLAAIVLGLPELVNLTTTEEVQHSEKIEMNQENDRRTALLHLIERSQVRERNNSLKIPSAF